MKKKILVNELSAGMYLTEVCGSWIKHPFWKSGFIVSSADIQSLKGARVHEVWIDLSKGTHRTEKSVQVPEPDAAASSLEMPSPRSDETLISTGDTMPFVPQCSMAEEAKRAKVIFKKSSAAIAQLFSEARMGKALSEDLALDLVEEISQSVLRNPGSLISMARLKTKDDYTYMHSVAVCALMVSLSKCMGHSAVECKQAGMAGLFHDIGKMFVDSTILNKPGKLTDSEFEAIKKHPKEGWDQLNLSGVSSETLDVCLHHHEKIDGSGYPDGLHDSQISMLAKMGAVCDVYDAITSDRPYKSGWEPADSIRKMAEWTGHFDQTIFRAFVKSIGIYPIGTLVKLTSGRLGIVVERGSKSLLQPTVKIFYSTKSHSRIAYELIDLSHPSNREKIESKESAKSWDLGDLSSIWMP